MVLSSATSVLLSELQKLQRLSSSSLLLPAACSISETLLRDFYGAFYTKAGRNPDPGTILAGEPGTGERKQDTPHLPGYSRVQIALQLLDVRMWRVLHLKPFLQRIRERTSAIL